VAVGFQERNVDRLISEYWSKANYCSTPKDCETHSVVLVAGRIKDARKHERKPRASSKILDR